MTEEQVLKAAQLLFPDDAQCLAVERTRKVNPRKVKNHFYIFNHSAGYRSQYDTCIVAHSERSWAHCLAIAKTGNEDCWPTEDAPMEEVSNA